MITIKTTTDLSTKIEQVLTDNKAELTAQLVEKMHAGVAHFYFYKKGKKPTDPPVAREAFGTLNKDLLQMILGPQDEDNAPVQPEPNSELTTQKYWDLEARAFRAFTVSNLICVL